MKIKVYANYNGKVITEEQYLEEIEKEANYFDEYENSFEDFLKDLYNYTEIFNLTQEEKEKIKRKFHEKNLDYAKDHSDWIENEIDI